MIWLNLSFHLKIIAFILEHIDCLPTDMHVVSVWVTWNSLRSAMSVVKSLVVWYHVSIPLRDMVAVTLTHCTLYPFLSLFSFLSPFVFSSQGLYFSIPSLPFYLMLSFSISSVFFFSYSLWLIISAHCKYSLKMPFIYNIQYSDLLTVLSMLVIHLCLCFISDYQNNP